MFTLPIFHPLLCLDHTQIRFLFSYRPGPWILLAHKPEQPHTKQAQYAVLIRFAWERVDHRKPISCPNLCWFPLIVQASPPKILLIFFCLLSSLPCKRQSFFYMSLKHSQMSEDQRILPTRIVFLIKVFPYPSSYLDLF